MPDFQHEPTEIELRPQEQLLIDALDAFSPGRILCTSQGLAQLAAAAARGFPSAAVYCHYLDLYRAEKARRHAGNDLANLSLGCSSDFPSQPVDLAALPMSAQGEAELTRELLQEAYQRLEAGGVLITSTDNQRDRWLHEEMRKLFATVTRRESSLGAVYLARRDRPLKRAKTFACEFAFRDRGRLIRAVSRPGVFSHREVDPGARRLMAAMEIAAGDRVLDMGCGSGTVSLAAAFRAEGVNVVAVDSHARAVECTALGASRNGLSNITVEHSACGPHCGPGTVDVVVANPPYYAGFSIARFFLETGHAALRPGGRIYVVSKRPQWYAEQMSQWFHDVAIEASKDYWIARGRR
ncbi:MAG: class I SAM-dependent methyltransferase [Thermoguttaceae bacterium]